MLADEHRIYERYVTEEMKKGIVEQPKEIETHKKKKKQKKTRTDEAKHYVTIFRSFSLN